MDIISTTKTKKNQKYSNLFFFENNIIYTSTKKNQKYSTYRYFANTSDFVIYLKNIDIVCIDIDLKHDQSTERDYVFSTLVEYIIQHFDSLLYIEFSKNGGIHIYIALKKETNKKQVYDTIAKYRAIEILVDKITTNQENIHPKSDFENINDFLNYAYARQITNDIHHTDTELINIFDTIDCISNTEKKEKKNNTIQKKDIIYNKKVFSEIIYQQINNISQKIKVDFVSDVLNHYGISYQNTGKGLLFNCLIHQPDTHKSACYYENTNIIVDYHDTKKYNILTYFIEANLDDFETYLKQKYSDVIIESEISNTNIFYHIDKTLKINNEYIDTETIAKVFDSEKQIVNLVADTGTGKTTAILKHCIQNNIKAIILFPYLPQTKQIEANLNTIINSISSNYDYTTRRLKIKVLYENVFYLKHDTDKNIIISTYDSIRKVKNIDDFDYLILDEYHNILLQSSFRKTAIYQIQQLLKYFSETNRKIINITATPQAVFYHTDLEDKEKTETIRVETTKKNISKFNVVKFQTSKQKLDYIINKHRQGYVDVVFYNNIKKILEIEKKLNSLGYTTQSIFSLKKQTEEFEKLYSTNQIENVDFLLTTTILSDGINILNSNINNIYFFNQNQHLISMLQFVNRFRTISEKNIFLLSLYNKKTNKINKHFDVVSEYMYIYEKATKLTEKLNKIDTNKDTHTEYIFKKIINSIKLNTDNILNYIFFDAEKKQYIVDTQKIRIYIFNKLNKFVKTNECYQCFFDSFAISETENNIIDIANIVFDKNEVKKYFENIENVEKILICFDQKKQFDLKTENLYFNTILKRLYYIHFLFSTSFILLNYDLFYNILLFDNNNFHQRVNLILYNIILQTTQATQKNNDFDKKTIYKIKILKQIQADLESEKYTKQQILKKYKKHLDIKFLKSVFTTKRKTINGRKIKIATIKKIKVKSNNMNILDIVEKFIEINKENTIEI